MELQSKYFRFPCNRTHSEKQSAILKDLANSVIALDEDQAVTSSKEALDAKIEAYSAISNGLAKGMEVMGEKYEKGTCFVPELLIASDAMYAGMDILKPHLVTDKVANAAKTYKGVIGVMEGDTHDIGKNLVKIMFEAAGFKMIDLGRDVPANRFVETAVKENADVICLSSLMTTAALGMGEVVVQLQRLGIREKYKILIGGACVSQNYAQKIGADAYAANAAAAVKTAKSLLEIKAG